MTRAQLNAAETAAWRAEIAQYRREQEAEIAAAREAAQVHTPIVQCAGCRGWIPAADSTCPRCGYDPIPF